MVATAISGPAPVYITASDPRAIAEPTTFIRPKDGIPFLCASRSAWRVSDVSPDCDIGISSVRPAVTGGEYRYSDASSTVTGMPASRSVSIRPISPACMAEPHPVITMLSIVFKSASSMPSAESSGIPSSPIRRVAARRITSGCSCISFSMK